MNIREQIKFFMEPKTIALIGVPRRTGKLSLNILENLLEYGYSGKVYPVNPGTDEILNVKTYPHLKDIPDEIDLAIIATPRPTVLEIVKDCAKKGVKAVAILTQGFADFDEEGRELEIEMVKVLKNSGGRLLGPNTLGIANAFTYVNTAFARAIVTRIPVGTIAQTGSFFTGTQYFLPSGKGIDVGNSADIDFSDCLEYFEDDPDIRVITLYIEGIQNGRRFMEVAKRVSRKKPILALKAGRNEPGSTAALSHTSQLAGNDKVYNAVFGQCGIIRVTDVEEQNDLAKSFSCLPLMKGKGLGIVTMSGSGGVLSADACQDHGLHLADLLPETKAKIQKMSFPWATMQNPIDIWPVIFSKTGTDLSKKYIEVSKIVLEIVAEDPTVDGILFIAGVFNKKDYIDPTEIVTHIAEKYKEKPIVCVLHGRNYQEITEKMNETGRTIAFPGYERAVRALGKLRQYAEFLEKKS